MKYRLWHGAFRLAVACMGPLPRVWVAALWEGIGWLVWLRGHPTVATNLSLAFGKVLTPRERGRIERKNFRHMGRSVGEILVLPGFVKADLVACVAVSGLAALQDALRPGRGALIVGCHHGNWEYQTLALGALLEPRYFAYTGELANPLFDAYINRLRASFGVRTILASARSTQEMVRVLRSGDVLAIAADINYRHDKYFCEFFGRLAATPTGPAALAVKAGSPVFFAWGRRTDPFRFAVEIRPLRFEPTGRLQADIATLTRLHVEALESVIRQDPVQYRWTYRRWKTRPPQDPDPVYP